MFEAVDEEWIDARPHPDPLPRGEGAAVVRAQFIVYLFGQSSRRFAPAAASDSPSPWGRGPG